MQNRSRRGFVAAALRRHDVILAIAATCRKTERMDNVGTIFYTAPVAPHVLINAFFLYSFLGWVMECIGRVPEAGDTFQSEGLDVTVTRVDHRRVLEIRVVVLPKEAASEPQ